MKRSLYSLPDQFSLSPLLSLLPMVGEVGRLDTFTSSIFARYEKVTELLRAAKDSNQDRDALRRFTAEEAMLKAVLDWLAVKPEGGA